MGNYVVTDATFWHSPNAASKCLVFVDFSPTAIAYATEEASRRRLSAAFRCDDCRTIKLESEFDLGICLYDVVGSFPDDDSNEKIVVNLARHIKPGGVVVISALSYDYLAQRARYIARNGDVQGLLLALRPSTTMQDSGEIFDPELIVLDEKMRVVYRKEQFDVGASLPVELIVRDRRYTFDDLAALCRKAGLSSIESGYVRAGKFNMMRSPIQDPTKEILMIARKNLL